MRPYITIVCIILALLPAGLVGQAISERVVSALKQNDAAALAATFHTRVEIQIPGYSGNYSERQASVILQKFLSGHPVGSAGITREGEQGDGSRYSLGELVAGGKKYRLYFVTRLREGKEKVMLLQVI